MDHQMRRENMTFLVKSGPVNMTRVWDKEKIWVSDRNLTHHLANTGKVLYPLSYKLSWRVRPFNWVHLTGILHTARIRTVKVVSVRDSDFFLFALIMLISSLNAHFITKVKMHDLYSFITWLFLTIHVSIFFFPHFDWPLFEETMTNCGPY